MNSDIEQTRRYNPSPSSGLTGSQVKERVREGLENAHVSVPTKSLARIIRENFLTLFNILNFGLALAVIAVGSYKNVLFMGVVLSNLVIGAFQEIRAKRAVDQLSLLSAKKAKVVRDSKYEHIELNKIVLDDIIVLGTGDQIPTDCVLCEGSCEVNESLLTGESDSITKRQSDLLLSGSFVVSGHCKAKAEKVGESNYVSKISKSAKYVKKVNSKISDVFKKIILVISVIIIPVGILLFLKQLNTTNNSMRDAVVKTVAALIGMIPEGLVLLTSTVLAVSVIRLSRIKVLVQQLFCIETLARVDVLCLDKTGTITEGDMELGEIKICGDCQEEQITEALLAMVTNLKDKNATFLAISSKYSFKKTKAASKVVHFSSERKWSGVYFDRKGSFILGAPEFVLGDDLLKFRSDVESYAKRGRVLVLAKSDNCFGRDQNDNFSLPPDVEAMAFIIIKDKIRKSAAKTLKYFKEQGVNLKIISGDGALSVMAIAKAVGFPEDLKYVDLTNIHDEEKIKKMALEYSVFGRVSPMQKKQIICALKEEGHTVAMTGDGVNDVLALKESDCSIAMASGSDAARNVSELVLLNSDFSTIPKITAEGRRCINNVQRSSSLFLVKTIYSAMLAIIFLFIKMPYPFEPIQMTLATSLTIGIPSFILALEPNKERIRGNFLLNIIGKSLPGAVTVVINVFLLNVTARYFGMAEQHISTISVILTAFAGFLVLYNVCVPFNWLRCAMFWSLVAAFVIAVILPKTEEIFSISKIGISEFLLLLGLMVFSFLVWRGVLDILRFILKKFPRSTKDLNFSRSN
ncbi:MAG: HAD-IC family P-type ATPase [Oscillospiraceae bacterium]|jgi:cation-transporting ATPase E|nr:HAD-IC family P-type ATPase [Oscillospiraceae bacterium]